MARYASSSLYSDFRKRPTLAVTVWCLCVSLVMSGAMPGLAATVPEGEDIYPYVVAGNTDLELEGNATWSQAIGINAARANLSIVGTGTETDVVSVRTNALLTGINSGQNLVLRDINFRPLTSGQINTTLLSASGTSTPSLDLSGSTFAGFYRETSTGTTILDVGSATILQVNADGTLFLNNQATRDSAAVIAVHDGGTLIFSGVPTLNANYSGNYGGAINVRDQANTLTFTDGARFLNNNTGTFGGAIDVWGNSASLVFQGQTEFTGNYAYYTYNSLNITDRFPRGGAINIGYIVASPSGASVTFDAPVTFRNNFAVSTGQLNTNYSALGGALSAWGDRGNDRQNYRYVFNDAAIFDNNWAYAVNGSGLGGAVYIRTSYNTLAFQSGTQFTNNYASTLGGAIYYDVTGGGTISFTADSADILFQGNRHGASFTEDYQPITGSGTPNSIYYANGSATLNLNAGDGYAIRFYDPVAMASGTLTLNKAGAGDAVLYGDSGTTTDYIWDMPITTTVSGGTLNLTDAVIYGQQSGSSIAVADGGALVGGNDAEARAATVTIASGGALGGSGGEFTLTAGSVTMASGASLTGYGSLASNVDISTTGTLLAEIASDTLEVTARLVGATALTKTGQGALQLSAANTLTGALTVDAGTLAGGVDDAFAQAVSVTVNAGGTLDLNNTDQIANNLSGAGDIRLTGGTLIAVETTAGILSGTVSGDGDLVKTDAADLTLSGDNSYSGGTSVYEGRVIATTGTALGSGTVTLGDDTTALELAFATAQTMANQISGDGALTKTGAGVGTLTASGASVGAVTVQAGGLTLDGTGAFSANSWTTATDAATVISADSSIDLATAFTQQSGASLTVDAGDAPAVTAATASLDGALTVTGYEPVSTDRASELDAARYVVISTTGGISGDFSSVDLGAIASPADYLSVYGSKRNNNLEYAVGLGLTWYAPEAEANGVFTLDAGASFIVDVALNDRNGDFTSGWDGEDLTKNGAGSLTLSGANTYTGTTTVNAGTLNLRAVNTIASSSAVTLNTGALLSLTTYDQTIRNLGGAGNVDLGSATLTLAQSDDTTLSGTISGTGNLNKTGQGILTLTGTNSYVNGTAIEAGTVVATNGSALGTGAVTISDGGTLNLNFTNNQDFANNLGGGEGSLIKTGAGTATLTGIGSGPGSVDVRTGGLTLAQDGAFGTGDYTTRQGATTTLAAGSTLAVREAFTQEAGAILSVNLDGSGPLISANTASLGGTLNVTGYTAQAPVTASALTGTRYVVVGTSGGISGDFSTLNLIGYTLDVDYLTASGGVVGTNYEIGLGLTWNANTTLADGTFTLADEEDAFTVDVALADRSGEAPFGSGWDGQSLTKEGDGTLTLAAANSYAGDTTVNAGNLVLSTINSIAQSAAVTVNTDGTLTVAASQTLNQLSGSGDLVLGSGATANAVNGANTGYSGDITGAGSLAKSGTGTLTLTGEGNTYSGGTTVNAGTLAVTTGTALGTGEARVNAAGTLNLNYVNDATLANTLTGDGTLTKTGTGTASLTGADSAIGAVAVNAGGLTLGQQGDFNATTYTTANGATTTLNDGATLTVSGTFTQNTGSRLNVTATEGVPLITANAANLDGTLTVTGYDAEAPDRASDLAATRFQVLTTTTGITGDFSNVNLDGYAMDLDYLVAGGAVVGNNYEVGLSLAWNAVASLADGVFTLTNADEAFTVDVALANRSGDGPFTSGWDGNSLTKEGDGTLTLAATNGYTGSTTVNDGTLSLTAANTIATSSAVTVNAGGTLNVAANQTLNQLSGAGQTSIASGATANAVIGSNEGYSGLVSGSGALAKSGAGTWTLSGDDNTYSGGTTVNAGTLSATTGKALGTGVVTVDTGGTLNLNYAADATLANRLAGSGTLTKTGNGAATLTATGSSVGTVAVNAGELVLAQNGAFTADAYTTGNGAATTLNEGAGLTVTGAFTQNGASALTVTVSNSEANINAGSASIDGTLNIEGFAGEAATQASQLPGQRYTVIATTGGITGTFSDLNFGTYQNEADYLIVDGAVQGNDYTVGLALAWLADATRALGTFTLQDEDDSFDVDVVLTDRSADAPFTSGWNGRDLTKEGEGTLILSAVNQYPGTTAVNAGTLELAAAGSINASSAVTVADGATLAVTNGAQTLNQLSGAGTLDLGSSAVTANIAAGNTAFSGVIEGNGSLVKTGGDTLTLSGDNSYAGGTTLSAGGLTVTTGTALGTGTVSTTSGTTLTLDLAANATVANRISGSGDLVKTGAGTVTLTAADSSANDVTINGGTLAFGQSGAFRAVDMTTQSGAGLLVGPASQVILSGDLTQDAGASLTVGVGNNEPAIQADGAAIDGDLIIQGLSGRAASDVLADDYTVISTNTGISGDFASVDFGGVESGVDYLILQGRKVNSDQDYVVGFNLTWNAGPVDGNGVFTMQNAANSFDVDVVLADQQPSQTGWNGRDLTKNGDGTLILSALNTYTGTTEVNGGTLRLGTANAIADSSGVTVASGATLDLDNNNQRITNLAGTGRVDLGSAVMTTVNNRATTFGGTVSGSGSLTKTGGSNLTLSGTNTYSGGTTISQGSLIASNTQALGTGAATVNQGATLNLANNADGNVVNSIRGQGSLIKSGSGTATLTGSGSNVGSVDVQSGTLALAGGEFQAGEYSTEGGAETAIRAGSSLAVTGTFTQDANSTLTAGISRVEPLITAANAVIDGAVNLSGFTSGTSMTASEIEDSRFTVIQTTGGISGDFASINFGSASSPVDYLVVDGRKTDNNRAYDVGFGLAWFAGEDAGTGSFTLGNANEQFDVDVVLGDRTGDFDSGWNGSDLTKNGDGTLILSAQNTYTGTTTVNGGTLRLGTQNAIADSGAVTVNSGSSLELAAGNQRINNLSGAGNIALGSNTMNTVNSRATTFAGVISGSGSLNKGGAANLTLSGANTYSGGTTVSQGTLIATNTGALGTGRATVNQGATLNLANNADGNVVNSIRGDGALVKTGTGTATLTGSGSNVGSVDVQSGTLALAGGEFQAGEYSTEGGAETVIQAGSSLTVRESFTQAANSALTAGVSNVEPLISAASASIDGILNLSGFTAASAMTASEVQANRFTVIQTTDGIAGDFDSVNFGSSGSTVDYLVVDGRKSDDDRAYDVGFGLAWYADEDAATGTFTLTGEDEQFDVDVALNDRTGDFASGWNGRDLTKNGLGTLILSAANTYSGVTSVNGGTLALRADDALGGTSQLDIADGATVLVETGSQSVGKLVTEEGARLQLDSSLTITDSQRDAGDMDGGTIAGNTLFGAGTLNIDPSDVTVTGANTGYTGNVNLSDGSSLILEDVAGVGNTGTVTLTGATDTLVLTGDEVDTDAAMTKQVAGSGVVETRGNADLTVRADNSNFSGTFLVNDDTALRASDASSLGSAGITLNGALYLTADSYWSMNNAVTGGGEFTKLGDDILNVNSSFAEHRGTGVVSAGTLLVGDGSASALMGSRLVTVNKDAILSGTGRVTGDVTLLGSLYALNALEAYSDAPVSNFTVGGLDNQGAIVLAGSSVGNTLTVRGDYRSETGTLTMNTVLGDDNSPTDRLIIDGGRVSGVTQVIFRNQGGSGAATDTGILVVEAVNGGTTDHGAFAISPFSSGFRGGSRSLVAGAYDYQLIRGGNGGDEQSWYLSSTQMEWGVRPEAGVYLANRESAEQMFGLRMHDRLAGYESRVDPETGKVVPGAAWVRIYGSTLKSTTDGGDLRTRTETAAMQTGIDLWQMNDVNYGSFQAGLMVGIGKADSRTTSRMRAGYRAKGDTEGVSVGGYATWFQDAARQKGGYLDGWVQHGWFDNTVRGDGLDEESYGSRLWSASLEGGYAIPLYTGERSSVALEPSAQAIWTNHSASDLTEDGGTRIRQSDDNNLTTRVGARVRAKTQTRGGTPVSPYVEAFWRHSDRKHAIHLDGDSVKSGAPRNVAEIRGGLAGEIGKNASLTLDFGSALGKDNYRGYSGQVGLRLEF